MLYMYELLLTLFTHFKVVRAHLNRTISILKIFCNTYYVVSQFIKLDSIYYMYIIRFINSFDKYVISQTKANFQNNDVIPLLNIDTSLPNLLIRIRGWKLILLKWVFNTIFLLIIVIPLSNVEISLADVGIPLSQAVSLLLEDRNCKTDQMELQHYFAPMPWLKLKNIQFYLGMKIFIYI